jgi:hypothetical protein
MTLFEAFIAIGFFTLGLLVASVAYCIPIRRLKKLVYKLKGQVYFWSRQIPVKKKPGRPRKKA